MKETLYIFNSNVELTKSKDSIKCIVQDAKGKQKTNFIPITRLNSVEVYGSIKVSTPLLKLCNELRIPCYFNTYYGTPIGQFIPSNSFPSIVRLNQYKTFLNKDKKLLIAKAIIIKASKERIRIIQKFKQKRNFNDKITEIYRYISKIEKIDDIAQLRGIEGNIMKNYFLIFSEMLNHLDFKKRTQQPPKDEANALLSFGNILLYNTVNSIVFRCALDPLVGFLHEPYENRNSLSIDISEIFRPIIIDNLILRLDHKSNLIPRNHFDKDEIKCYLNEKGKRIWVREYRNFLKSSIKYKPLKRFISIQEEIKIECYNLIKFLTGESDDYLPIQFNNS